MHYAVGMHSIRRMLHVSTLEVDGSVGAAAMSVQECGAPMRYLAISSWAFVLHSYRLRLSGWKDKLAKTPYCASYCTPMGS